MKIVVLTLASRQARLDAFNARWPGQRVPMRVQRTDQDHRQAMRGVWADLDQDTLVLEDDVILLPGWAAALDRARELLPPRWDLLYLGGQHAFAPQSFADGLVRCAGTHRSHATLVHASSVPRLLALTATAEWEFLDADLSRLMETGRLHAFALQPWVAGQAAGYSDITQRDEPERWWHHPEEST